ncbi:MAG: hypothetical protein WC401_11050 [Bacteroidales bacterium]|jgi:hypothetical protein|nr:hypothetical protein [Bacteroidales bacterium]
MLRKTKKNILIKKLIFVFFLSFILFQANSQNCPRNSYDCKGACGWFVDVNHDGYCDLTTFTEAIYNKLLNKKDSVPIAENNILHQNADSSQKHDNSSSNTDTSKQKNKENFQNNVSHNCPFANTPECEINRAQQNNSANANFLQNNVNKNENKSYEIKKYDFFLIFSFCIFFYLFTWLLSKRKILKKSTHKRIWNSLLLLSFINTGLTGLFLVIQLNYLVLFEWFSKLLFWHVEFGISMAAISIVHILWHWKYFRNIIAKPKEKDTCN